MTFRKMYLPYNDLMKYSLEIIIQQGHCHKGQLKLFFSLAKLSCYSFLVNFKHEKNPIVRPLQIGDSGSVS